MRSKKVVTNIISSLILQAVAIVCSFIVPRLIISNFGSNVNGLIESITQFLTYITLLESGFGPVIKSLLFKPIANKDKITIQKILKKSEKIFRIIAYLFIIYILLLCIILPLVLTNEFDNLFTISLIIIIGISTFAEYFFGMTYKLYLQAEQKKYVTSIIQIGILILNTIVVVVLVRLGASIQVVKLVSALVFVLRPILQNVYVKKKYNINFKMVKEDYKIKQKWDGLAQHIAYVINYNTDIILLTICKNVSEVSVYSVYMLVINGLKNIVNSFTGGVDASFGDMIAKEEYESLNKNFKIYELFYFTIATIMFIMALVLIVPFISLYTKGIEDVNYIRPAFAYIMVIAKFVEVARIPYGDLAKVAGHFKQTRRGAWLEAIANIVISLILVFKFGIIGVAIGTLVAMCIRTVELMYHSSKYILKRNVFYTFKIIPIIMLEALIILIIYNIIPKIEITGYLKWAIEAVIIGIIATLVICIINSVIYKENLKKLFKLGKNILKRKNNIEE